MRIFVSFFLGMCLISQSALSAQEKMTWEFVEKSGLKPLQGTEVLLTEIIVEPQDDKVHELVAVIDEETSVILGMIRRSDDTVHEFTFEELVNNEVVLAEVSGRDAITVQCADCSDSDGGELKLKYLYNGMNMTYRNFFSSLAGSTDEWALKTDDGTVIYNLKMVTRSIFGRTIGIKRIDINV